MIAVQEGNSCASMQKEIEVRYEYLRSSKTLAINRPGNDISDILLKYVDLEKGFTIAEKFLRQCGFDVSEQPGKDAPGTFSDRYDVYASSRSIIRSRVFGVGIEVLVSLRPNDNFDYQAIKKLMAIIQVTAL